LYTNSLWRLGQSFLPTRFNLGRKGMKIDLICPLCKLAEETQHHLFMDCPATQTLWFTSPLDIHVRQSLCLNDWIVHWLSSPEKLDSQLFCIIL
jgi:hypothetical protein